MLEEPYITEPLLNIRDRFINFSPVQTVFYNLIFFVIANGLSRDLMHFM